MPASRGAAARGVPVGVSRANESVDRSVTAPAKSASASGHARRKVMPKSSSPPRASPPRVAASASASNDARISDVAASRPCSPSPPARSTSRSSVTCADDVPRRQRRRPPRMRATSRAVSDWRAHQRRRAAHVDVVEPQRERGRAERRGGARRGARVRPGAAAAGAADAGGGASSGRPRSRSHRFRADEFQRFLTAFSVRPGRSLAISLQRLPWTCGMNQ